MFRAWLWATQSGASGSNNHLQFTKDAQPLVPLQVHWVRIYILTKSLMVHGQIEVQGVRAEASLEFLYFSRYTLHPRSLALWELNSHTTESHPPTPQITIRNMYDFEADCTHGYTSVHAAHGPQTGHAYCLENPVK